MDEFDSRNDRGSPPDIVTEPVLTFPWHYEITGSATTWAEDVGKNKWNYNADTENCGTFHNITIY